MITDLCTTMGWPKSPSLRPEVRRELELQGIDAARSWLSAQVDTRDTTRGRTYPDDFSDRRPHRIVQLSSAQRDFHQIGDLPRVSFS